MMRLIDRLFPKRGDAQLWLLLDPDSMSPVNLRQTAAEASHIGVNAILIGGSLITHDRFDASVRVVKRATKLPVVLFPGGSSQISRHADGILFISLLSGRNPQYLIGEQVKAAPIIKRLGLEAISTAYLLIESGRMTSIEYVSNTKPIPRDKALLAVAHAQAAELFGMQVVYLETGSGAEQTVPPEMIRAVVQSVALPVIVGGGINTPKSALAAVKAGARAIVVGTAVEREGLDVIRGISQAIRRKR